MLTLGIDHRTKSWKISCKFYVTVGIKKNGIVLKFLGLKFENYTIFIFFCDSSTLCIERSFSSPGILPHIFV